MNTYHAALWSDPYSSSDKEEEIRYPKSVQPCHQIKLKSNPIKFIYIALRTSADISKCCTESQPKTLNSKQCRCRSTVARKNSLERPPPQKKPGTAFISQNKNRLKSFRRKFFVSGHFEPLSEPLNADAPDTQIV